MPSALEAGTRHPLFGLLLTLGAYRLALWWQRRSGWCIAQPVLTGTLLVVAALYATGLEYDHYRQTSGPLWLLLGPATVALAVPLYLNLGRIRRRLWPLLITIGVGATANVLLVVLLASRLGAETPLLIALAPKSVTSPIAISLAEGLGGSAALAAVFVMLTGVAGALLAPLLLRMARVESPAARGVALGLNAHAVGTSQALQESREAGGFAALAMSLTGAITALLLPLGGPWLLGRLSGAG
ncbi:LrgB family protein [Halomonas koreensis]|uniref:LrgB family protein n=1 Tax=Halomonas koreensis TaxID=245385 RepID=A0ABU1G218_9GAMM|nr:LrgB family protein [Halomonas koreensis]MDR5866746.1 LrgB family protein [Halomonas koreensis]